ncbi:bacterioferritin-associated ferredoxin [Ectothiorhodospiraceae bacterium 2226]|nr:bacterioferritin-associated ferredoxin [Ectothiorhodospiraceae bacterium 2226]
MYVCLCQGVTDRQIRAAAEDGARTVRDLNRRLGVGTGCGKCTSCAREVLAAHPAVRVAPPTRPARRPAAEPACPFPDPEPVPA